MEPANGRCPALKIPVLAVFTTPMKNGVFRVMLLENAGAHG
jgi:hypothetical protein